MSELAKTAQRALHLLDLTDLGDECCAEDVRDLCARAQTPFGHVAAICIWPRFVTQARPILVGTGIRIATVVDFPSGDGATADVFETTEQAVADGADEIDMVIPYKRLIEGHKGDVPAAVARVRRAAGSAKVKAILETGILAEADLIRQAAECAIEGGADFIKTSTGKVPVNATPEAARVMLEVIAEAGRPVGLKPAGGVRTTEDAQIYLDLCDQIMGADWAGPETFRIGASSVLGALLEDLGAGPAAASGGY
ncbi:MAG: deoxyribose-phosphate aldolase [Pseudomonadota bacterium]